MFKRDTVSFQLNSRCYCVLILSIFFSTAVYGQLSGEEILRKVESQVAGLQDYTVSLDVTVDLEGINVPPMDVTMYYKRPDKVRFTSEGFALLPKEGIGIGAGALVSKYSVESVDGEVEEGIKEYALTLRPKDDRTKLRQVYLHIDAEHWTVRRAVSPLFDGRTMTAMFSYEEHDGYWLPSFLTVTFSSAESDTTEDSLLYKARPMLRPQMPRNGSISIRYSDYNLNTGLSDEVFEQKGNGAERE